jgi:hypothetical protein
MYNDYTINESSLVRIRKYFAIFFYTCVILAIPYFLFDIGSELKNMNENQYKLGEQTGIMKGRTEAYTILKKIEGSGTMANMYYNSLIEKVFHENGIKDKKKLEKFRKGIR